MERAAGAARQAAVLGLAALPLLWVALANGFPLLFADSGTYLRVGTELAFPLDRPVTYGLLILPFHRLAGLWAVAVAQALFAAFVVGRALALVLDRPRPWHVVATTAMLAGTGLPWFAGQVMPDLFAGLLPLVLFVLVGAPAMRWPERAVWTLLAAGLVALHLSHLPLAAAVIAALLVCGGARRRDVRLGAALATGGLALAVLGLCSVNLVAAGRFRPSVMDGSFLFTRLLDARLAQPVLDRECARANLLLCAVRPLANDPARALPGQDYLWNGDSPRPALARADQARLAAEEKAVVGAVLAERPGAVLSAALRGWAAQLVTARSGDGLFRYEPDTQVHRQVTRHFPGSADAWAGSRQQRDALRPLAEMPDVALAAAALLLVALATTALRDARLAALATAVVAALIANAAICSVLSGVFDRYQSRVLWLLPFAAIVGAWRRIELRRWADPGARPLVPAA